jgi:hypothetical protein
MFGDKRYKQTVPVPIRALVAKHGLPRPSWFIASMEGSGARPASLRESVFTAPPTDPEPPARP